AKVLGVIELKDIVKTGIKDRFGELRRMGIKTVMITGDNKITAAAIAAEAGVYDFLAEATPEEKLRLIRQYQAREDRRWTNQQRDLPHHRLVHHPPDHGRTAGSERPRDRRQGPVGVPRRKAGQVEPRRIHLLERRKDVWSEVATLQDAHGPAEIPDRSRAAPEQSTCHQPAHRP